MWNNHKMKECKKKTLSIKKVVKKKLEVYALLWTFGISSIAMLLWR